MKDFKNANAKERKKILDIKMAVNIEFVKNCMIKCKCKVEELQMSSILCILMEV